jgi:hypothetical protein
MRLSAQLLQQIVGHPVDHFSGSGHQRALGRVAVGSQVSVFPIRGDLLDDPMPATLRDISTETASLTMLQAMMPSARLIVRIPVANGQSVAIRCRIMRCSRQQDFRFSMAAQFQQLVDSETLHAVPPS